MNAEGQDSKTVYSFVRIDLCSKYISFDLLELLSTRTFVLLPLQVIGSKLDFRQYGGIIVCLITW